MSLNGDFNGWAPFRPPIDLPRWRDARPRPEHDRDEVLDVRRALGPVTRRAAVAVDSEDVLDERMRPVAVWCRLPDPELEAGALADLARWGCNPFEEG